MTTKDAFTEQEWETIREAPVSAGMIVVTAQKGGTFRESFAMAKAYAEARQQHGGGSELVEALVGEKPARDHHHYHSYDELKQAGLQHVHEALAVLEQKATPEDVDAYRKFVLALADRVAHAHREHGQEVSEAEQAALDEIAAAFGSPPAAG
jgi:hypothetical protein